MIEIMSSTKPSAPAELITAANRLHFRPTSRSACGRLLGVLVDASGVQHHLAIVEGDADGTWALFRALPAGMTPVLLYESAANVLCGGSSDGGGGIAYQGDSYVIESLRSDGGWTARVSGSR
jgi:hypothetical protein